MTAALPRQLQQPPRRAALFVVSAALLLAFLLVAGSALRPFVVGLLLVFLLSPLVDRLAQLGLSRSLAALIVILLSAAGILALLAIILTPLVAQAAAFADDLPRLISVVRRGLDDAYAGLNLAPEVRQALDDMVAGAGRVDVVSLLRPIVGGAIGVIGGAVGYVILPAWLFFVLRDWPSLTASFVQAMPASWRPDVQALAAITSRALGRWVRAQLVLGGVVGAASFVGLQVLAVTVDPVFARYAVLLALAAGLLELLPLIGPIISAVPAVLVGATAGLPGVVAALLLYTAIQQVENQALVPKIQGAAISLHPGVVIVALVVGGAVAGLLGAILSLPLTAVARDAYRYAFHRLGDPPAAPAAAIAIVCPSLATASPPVYHARRRPGPRRSRSPNLHGDAVGPPSAQSSSRSSSSRTSTPGPVDR